MDNENKIYPAGNNPVTKEAVLNIPPILLQPLEKEIKNHAAGARPSVADQ